MSARDGRKTIVEPKQSEQQLPPLSNRSSAENIAAHQPIFQPSSTAGSGGYESDDSDWCAEQDAEEQARLEKQIDATPQEPFSSSSDSKLSSNRPSIGDPNTPMTSESPDQPHPHMIEPQPRRFVSPSSTSERACIQKFGISYEELVTNLVADDVISEPESRLIRLVMSSTLLPLAQECMLNAIFSMEENGITSSTVTAFRAELQSVIVSVAQESGVVEQPVEHHDVVLARPSMGQGVDSDRRLQELMEVVWPGGQSLRISAADQQHASVELEASMSMPSVAEGEVENDGESINPLPSVKSAVVHPRVPVIDQVFVKVAKHIAELPPERLLREQVILVGSGAYNPIHKLHLRMFYIARKYLEDRTEFGVLGGLISPSHATDVRSRNRQRPREIIPPRHRLAMARAAVGDSTWLTVDPWEITRRRVMDYLSVLDHVHSLFVTCFPELPVKLVYLCSTEVLVKLSPDDLRDRGFACLCVCRPQETDRLLSRMGSRWKNVAYVVEDTAILSQELELATSAKVRQLAIQGKAVEGMVGHPVAAYMSKHRLGPKMSGKVGWSDKDREFQLDNGLAQQDRGYTMEPNRPKKRPSKAAASRIQHRQPFKLI